MLVDSFIDSARSLHNIFVFNQKYENFLLNALGWSIKYTKIFRNTFNLSTIKKFH